MPSEPPRKSNGCTAIITGRPSSVPRAAVKSFDAAGLGPGGLQLVGITFLVAEMQRIGRNLGRRQFVERNRHRRSPQNAPPARCACDGRIAGRHSELRSDRDGKSSRRRPGHFFQRFSGVSLRALRPIRLLDPWADEIGDPVHGAHPTTLSGRAACTDCARDAAEIPAHRATSSALVAPTLSAIWLDNGRAHHRGIGNGGRSRPPVGRLDAKAHRAGQSAGRVDARHRRCHVVSCRNSWCR